MKRFVITQYGAEEREFARTFVVELPDGADESRLDNDRLGALADAELGWKDLDESSGINATHYEVEEGLEEDERAHPIIHY